MNVARMNRGDKTKRINEELSKLIKTVDQKWTWLVITEGWCGDAAQSIPILVKLAELNPNFDIKFVLRDAHSELMDAYLTNGTRSIPKLIIFSTETLEELYTWGPRPSAAQAITDDYKKKNLTYEEYSLQLHSWYAKDKYQSVQNELLSLLS